MAMYMKDKDGNTQQVGFVHSKAYSEGKKAAYDEFWDNYQQNGKRTNYSYAFAGSGWSDEVFKPKYDIIPTYTSNMFYGNTRITNLKEQLDSRGIKIIWDNAANFYYLCTGATALTRVGEIGNRRTNMWEHAFSGCTSLISIDKIIVSDTTTAQRWTNAFHNCKSLETLTIDGVINGHNFNVAASAKLTHESLMSIITALKDYSKDTSGTVWKITLGATNIAKLTEDEIAIAEAKGWEVA